MRSAPQMTRRMGKSFAQLLTSRAVLIAVGLAAVGGGRGRIRCNGAVDVRRGSGGRCVIGDGSGGVVTSLESPGLSDPFACGIFGFTG